MDQDIYFYKKLLRVFNIFRDKVSTYFQRTFFNFEEIFFLLPIFIVFYKEKFSFTCSS